MSSRMVKKTAFAAALGLSGLLFAGSSQAGVILNVIDNGEIGHGLHAYTLQAQGTDGDLVGGVANLNVTSSDSGMYQVVSAFGTLSPTVVPSDVSNATSPLWNDAWTKYDTHLLFNPQSLIPSGFPDPTVGAPITEDDSNVGTNDPANLTSFLPGTFPITAKAGVSSFFKFNGNQPQASWSATAQAATQDLMHLVLLDGTSANVSLSFVNSAATDFFPVSQTITATAVTPEPGSLALLGLGGLLLAGRRRRQSA